MSAKPTLTASGRAVGRGVVDPSVVALVLKGPRLRDLESRADHLLDVVWTMPSGEPKTVSVRRKLKGLIFGPGHFRKFTSRSSFVTPAVVHADTETLPSADAVCVGSGNNAATLTPWSCPLLPGLFSAGEALHVIRSRADVCDWLSRLSGETFTCRCRRSPSDCWAWILRAELIETFGDDDDEKEEYTYHLDDADDYSTVDLPLETYFTYRDNVDFTSGSACSVPQHVPWPLSWCQLVRTVHELQPPVFGIYSRACQCKLAHS